MYDQYEEMARKILIEVARAEMKDGADLESACAAILDVECLMGEIAYNEHPMTLLLDLEAF